MFIYNKLLSLNEYRNMHYHKLNKMKLDWEQITKLSARFYEIKPVKKAKLHFTLLFADNRRRDLDNYSATIKMILDGLVKAEIFADDDKNHITAITIDWHKVKSGEGIMIKIEEVNE